MVDCLEPQASLFCQMIPVSSKFWVLDTACEFKSGRREAESKALEKATVGRFEGKPFDSLDLGGCQLEMQQKTIPIRLGTRRTRSPSPSRLGEGSPFTSPLTSPLTSPFTSAPNSPFSSEGGYYSDGGSDDTAVGAAPSASSTKRKTPDDGPSPKRQTVKNKEKAKLNKRVREPRYTIQTRSEVDVLEDGYKWRKYGQKAVKNTPHPRNYYRCTNQKCPVRKRVERAREDFGLVITTYEGTHNHLSPAPAAANASPKSR
ncbi:hypothetical protein M758_12G032600 [Ceratodon purpureus]|nr:hypothetical protein M758_12G032600 [Ceratodon purpureus]